MKEQVRTTWRDAWLPGLLLALGTAELASLGTDGWVQAVGVEAVAAVLLVFRRRLPLVVVPLSAAALVLVPMTGTGMDEAAAPILFYVLGVFSLGRWLLLRSGVAALGVVLVLVFVTSMLIDPAPQDWTDVVFVLALALPPYVFGRIVRQLDEQSRLLAAQQEQIHDQAVQEERDRIARELHDVIAHSISAMVVQAAAAREVLDSRPARAAELLDAVTEAGRAALAETGHLLHLVRDEAGELGRRPAPTLADVPRLVDSFRDGGLDVVADLDLPTTSAAGGVDLSAYRVVQEALTNAVKHGDGPVRLRLASAGECLSIRCTNRVGSSGGGSGLGLRGMAERVSTFGGRITTTVTPAGDFVLDVELPLHEVAP